jgi:hypothetical protein
MVVETLVNRIQTIRDRLILSPLSDNLTAVLEEEQENLRLLLEEAAHLPEEDRQKIRTLVDAFAQDLQGRVQALQAKIDEMSLNMDESRYRQKAVQAYNGGAGKLY